MNRLEKWPTPVCSVRCAAAYTAYAMVAGVGTWVGDPREGVVVLPAEELLPRYDKLPPPARAPLVG